MDYQKAQLLADIILRDLIKCEIETIMESYSQDDESNLFMEDYEYIHSVVVGKLLDRQNRSVVDKGLPRSSAASLGGRPHRALFN